MTEFIYYPNYTNFRYFSKKLGYWFIKVPKTHAKYNKNQGYIYEHRWIMEQHLGRYLNKNEHVHHINEIKTDNRIENLVLTKGQSDHIKTYHPYIAPNYTCLLCGNTETGLTKKYKYQKWTKYKDGWICNICYMDLYNEKLKQEHANQTEFVKCICSSDCEEMIPKYTRMRTLSKYADGHELKRYNERRRLEISKRVCLICGKTNIKTRWSKHLDGHICRNCKYKRDGWN